MKDMPARLAPGLALGAVPPRAPAHDVLIGGGAGGLRELAAGTRIGTASVRRRAQLLASRRDIDVVPLRGNVDTRLRRWREGDVDALVLAAAGLERLGIAEPAARPLAPEEFLPPVGQGALALECRGDDADTRALLRAIEDDAAAVAVAAERAFLRHSGRLQHAARGACDDRGRHRDAPRARERRRRTAEPVRRGGRPARRRGGARPPRRGAALPRAPRSPRTMTGRVYLVGAGPGDPGLTRRGERCLAAADVVVHDYLVGPRLLELARPDAEIVALGRSHADPGRLGQDEIEALLVARVQARPSCA
jgi:hypothetical protein